MWSGRTEAQHGDRGLAVRLARGGAARAALATLPAHGARRRRRTHGHARAQGDQLFP